MNFEKLRSDVEQKKEITDFFLKEEKRGEFYPAYDCDLKDFNSRFGSVLSEKNIPEYLDQNYNDKKGELIGVELGGPGCQLFADLNGYFLKTVGFTLYNNFRLVPPPGHQVIEADVFSKRIQKEEGDLQGYQVIEEWVEKNGKADLLICSMGDGVNYGLNEDLFIANLKRWYKLLSPQGTFLLSLPDFVQKFTYSFNKYLKFFLTKHRDIFDFDITTDEHINKLRLRKIPNSPDSIDTLVDEFIKNMLS